MIESSSDEFRVSEIVARAASIESRPLALAMLRALVRVGEKETSPLAALLLERAANALARLEGPVAD